MSYAKSNIYNISSKNAKVIFNGNALSSGLWTFPNLNFKDDNIRNAYISIQHAEIPNTFYIVNSSNDTIYLSLLAPTQDYTITIPHGNYNVNTFITAVTPLLPTGFTLTYSTITCKITFTHSSRDFILNTTNTTARDVIGLGNTNQTSTGRILTMPNNVNFLPTARLNIRSSSFALGNFGIDGASDIILTIQNNGGQTARILYQNYNNQRFLLDKDNLQEIDLRITIDNGSLCEFNGVDWYITFQIDVEYYDRPKKDSFQTIIDTINKKYLELG